MEPSRFNEVDFQEAQRSLEPYKGAMDLESFKEWLAWPETIQRLVDRYGPDYTIAQAVELAVGGKKRKSHKASDSQPAPAEAAPAPPELSPDTPDSQVRLNRRLAEYHQRFADITPNDRATILDLVTAELAAEETNRMLTEEFGKGVSDALRVSNLNQTLKLLSDRMRLLQRALGIDRATREREVKKRGEVDEVLDLMDAAGAWVENEAIRLVHCDTLYGYLITDFREQEAAVEWNCPACKERVRFEHVPTEEDLKANEPEWVAVEEEPYRSALAVEREEEE